MTCFEKSKSSWGWQHGWQVSAENYFNECPQTKHLCPVLKGSTGRVKENNHSTCVYGPPLERVFCELIFMLPNEIIGRKYYVFKTTAIFHSKFLFEAITAPQGLRWLTASSEWRKWASLHNFKTDCSYIQAKAAFEARDQAGTHSESAGPGRCRKCSPHLHFIMTCSLFPTVI